MVSIDGRAAAIIGVAAVLGVVPHAMANSSFLYEVNRMSFQANATAVNQSAEETKNIGVVTDSNLRFGSIPAGSASMKFLNVTAPKKSSLQIEVEGNISDKLQYRKWNYFEGDREIKLRFNSTEPGYYEGEIMIKTRTPRNTVGEAWLDVTSLSR